MEKNFFTNLKLQKPSPLSTDKLAVQSFSYIEDLSSSIADELGIGDRSAAISVGMLAFHEAVDTHKRGPLRAHASAIIRGKITKLGEPLAGQLFSHVPVGEYPEIVSEISDLSSALDRFKLCYIDAAAVCPTRSADLAACRNAVRHLMESSGLFNDFLYERNDYLVSLSTGAGINVNLLKNHRNYILALLFMQAGDFPILQEHCAPGYNDIENGFIILSNYESFSVALDKSCRIVLIANFNHAVGSTVNYVVEKVTTPASSGISQKAIYIIGGTVIILAALIIIIALALKNPDPVDASAATATPTQTVSVTTAPASPTPTATVDATATASPANTAALTATPTQTPQTTAPPTASPGATTAPSVSPRASASPTPTVTATATPTLSPTATPTVTPTATPTPSPTETPTETPSATPVPTRTPSGTTFYVQTGAGEQTVVGNVKTADAEEMFQIINSERAKAGSNALTYDYEMVDAAQQRAAEITVVWSHTRPNGLAWYFVSDRANGENLAYGQSNATSAMADLMASPDHKDNILNNNYTRVAIGCFEIGGKYYWVQLFGI